MKHLFKGIVVLSILFAACNNANNPKPDETQLSQTTGASDSGNVSIKGIVTGYLQLKNALSSDDANAAASGAKGISEAFQRLDTTGLTPDQQKAYAAIHEDMKEHAEHISMNADKIAHQREHFELLSKDMYDLLKVFPAEQTLYRDFCPMYNNGKGAFWVSETKDIKNPYYGSKMLTCGEVKEEIK